MIIIAGTITIAPERRASCLDESRPWQEGTRRDEPGCSAYVFCPDPIRDDTICVYERWDDAASLDAHFQHPNYWGMRELFARHGITGADVAKYRIDAAGPVYGPDGVASAAFPNA